MIYEKPTPPHDALDIQSLPANLQPVPATEMADVIAKFRAALTGHPLPPLGSHMGKLHAELASNAGDLTKVDPANLLLILTAGNPLTASRARVRMNDVFARLHAILKDQKP